MNLVNYPTPKTDEAQVKIWWRADGALMCTRTDEVSAEFARELERENMRLRAIFPKILEALGNDSSYTANASLEFFEKIPEKIRLEIQKYRQNQ